MKSITFCLCLILSALLPAPVVLGQTITQGGGSVTVSSTHIPYGNAQNRLTSEAAFTYNAGTNTGTIGALNVDTEVYDGAGWNGDLSVPTKDAVRDKIESLAGGGFDSTTVDNPTWSDSTQATLTWTFDLFDTDTSLVIDDNFWVFNAGSVHLGAAGVQLAHDGDGALTFTGLGNGFDEALTVNLDDTENNAVWSSSTGISIWSLSGIQFQSAGATFSDILSFTGTTHPGLRLNNLTTAQRDGMTPLAGYAIWNTDTDQPEWYDGAIWVNFSGESSGVLDISKGGTGEVTAGDALIALGGGGINIANTWTLQNTFSKAPAIPRTDLAAGTALTIGTYYFDALSANRTLTFSGTPAEGQSTSLKLVVTNNPTLTIPSCKRAGEANSAITSLFLYNGVHTLTWTYINSEYILTDTVGVLNKLDGTTAPTANEDVGDGYTIGSVWIDTTNDKTYICVDSTSTAAVWRISGNAITGTGDSVLATAPTLNGAVQLAENASIALDPAGSADGKYSGTTIAGTAGAALAFGDIVYLAAADSRWELADCDSATTSGNVLIGMVVLAAGADGNATTILLNGTIRADTAFPSLTISAPAYISGTAGDIQVAAPSTTGQIVRRVGFALTADELYFNPSADSGTAP